MTSELSLVVNGEPRRAPAGQNIAELVAALGFNPAKVAVERNGEIVPRATLAGVVLGDGDQPRPPARRSSRALR